MSCQQSNKAEEVKAHQAVKVLAAVSDSMDIHALAFINGYVENVNKLEKGLSAEAWSSQSMLVTAHFRAALHKLEADAYKEDPELGLDADPILNAQDVPDKGFVIKAIDKQAGYIVVMGKDEPAFTVTMKMIRENGRWLVDGCGIVNIPERKRDR